jgi:hypothetical protein
MAPNYTYFIVKFLNSDIGKLGLQKMVKDKFVQSLNNVHHSHYHQHMIIIVVGM